MLYIYKDIIGRDTFLSTYQGYHLMEVSIQFCIIYERYYMIKESIIKKNHLGIHNLSPNF